MTKFTKAIGVAALMAGFAAGSAGAADKEMVAGYWLTADKSQVVEIKTCEEGAGRLCGDVVWSKAEVGGDTQVISGMRPSKSNLSKGHFWTKGKVVNLDSGKSRAGSMELLEDGTLKVAACKRSLCSNQIWERPSAEMAELPEHIRLASR